MPTVPRANPESVGSLKALPDVKVTGGATEETFGGGASGKEVGTALQGLSDAGVKLAIAHQTDMDKAYAASQDPVLVKLRNDAYGDIAQNYKLSKAINVPERVKQYITDTDPIIEAAPNPETKSRLIKARNVYLNQLDSHGQSFMVEQSNQWYDISKKNRLKSNAADSGINYDKPDVIQANIFKSLMDVKDIAEKQGYATTFDPNRPEEIIPYQEMKQEAVSAIHTSVIQGMMSENTPAGAAKALAYYNKYEKQIFNKEERIRVGNLVKDEALNQRANLNAAKIMTENKSTIDAAAQIEAIENPKEREATKKAFTTLNRQNDVVFYKNSSSIVEQEANGQYDKLKLENDRKFIPDQIYQSMSFAQRTPAGAELVGTETENMTKMNNTYSSLFNEAMSISSKDIYDQPRATMDYQRKVMLAKGKLNDAQYRQLLGYSLPGFTVQVAPEKAPWYKSMAEAVQNYFARYTVAGVAANVISKIAAETSGPSVKPEDIPVHTQKALKGLAIQNNSELNMAPDVTNSTASKNQGVKPVYEGPSKAKADRTITKSPAQKAYREKDIIKTAQDNGMTVEEVKKKLGII